MSDPDSIEQMISAAGTSLEIDLDAISDNVRELARISSTDVIAVVKGDGYGHGAEASAWAALRGGAVMLAVFSVEEAVALRRVLPDPDVLVLLGALDDHERRLAIRERLILTVWSVDAARALASMAAEGGSVARVHVKVDTGMTRLGVPAPEAADRYRAIRAIPGVRVEGIFTHLADANELVDDVSARQISAFRDVLGQVERPRWIHVAASSVIRASSAADICTAIRPGRALFGPGLSVVDGAMTVRAPMVWRSQVSRIEAVPSGTPVSYGGDYRTPRATRIATVPVGYGHGLPRAGGRRLRLIVGGEALPIAGRVTMDSVMLDVGDRPIRLGDEVLVVGSQGGTSQSLLEVADACGTIPEELTARIPARVPRHYFVEGRLVARKTLASGFEWC